MTKFTSYSDYLNYIEANYDEEEQITIENFISYYINRYNGFGRLNCEETYQEGLVTDITGKLHKIALIGFEFEKSKFNRRKNSK